MAPGPRAAGLRLAVSALLRYVFGHQKAVLVLQNPDDASEFTRRGIVEPEQIVLIRGTGVDLNRFALSSEPNAAPLVVLPSRMLWDKGVGEFVEAARIAKREAPDARFALVGEPDPNNPTSIPLSQLEAWRQEGVVEWWGFRPDMPEVIANAHIVCLPSYREGLPRVLIEAAACGRPVVSTDAPGCREIARHGENGLLVPVKNAGALAEAVLALLKDPALRTRMGKRGREMVENGFSVESVVNETLDVYAKLLHDGA